MSGEKERDRSVDRVLRQATGGRTDFEPQVSSACLDAETLAAWADGDLPAGERAAAEQHVADCARCQAMLAALVRTNPEPAPARPWWRLSRSGWLVPIAATAAAVAIWIAVPDRPPTRPQELAARPDVAPSLPTPASPATSAPPASSAPAATPAATPSAQSAPAAPKAEPDTVALRARASETDVPAAREELPATAAQAAPATPPATPSTSRALGRAAAQSEMKILDARAAVDIVSADPMIRWRIVGGRDVQRSTDGGATWQPQQAGATSDLLAGSSPSPEVCWLVGRAGLVLLTIDGRQWRVVVLPVAVDLSAVRASDARTAVITTSDGRTFRTSDAGRTWMP